MHKFEEYIWDRDRIILDIISQIKEHHKENIKIMDKEMYHASIVKLVTALHTFYDNYYKDESKQPSLKLLRVSYLDKTDYQKAKSRNIYLINYAIENIEYMYKIVNNTKFIGKAGLIYRDNIIDDVKDDILSAIIDLKDNE